MKTVIITGANAGIGFATAKFLAARPEWHILLACRSESKANAAIGSIRSDGRLGFVALDLFSLASVRRWFVNLMGSHLSTQAEAAQALGGLLSDAEYSGVSGRYFDGSKEILSSIESRDESKDQNGLGTKCQVSRSGGNGAVNRELSADRFVGSSKLRSPGSPRKSKVSRNIS